ncbi:hypothetical protein GC209_19405 [bacterium]|nr:hypothetical protein [bacterium]
MSEETDLTEALLAAATGYGGKDGPADLWPGFLRRLAAAMGAGGISMTVTDGPSWQVGLEVTPLDAAVVARMRWDRVYSRTDLPGAEPAGPALRALRAALPGGGQVVILALRQGQDFRAVDSVRLSAFGPLTARALAGWLALRDERARTGLEAQAAAGLGLGWVLLSPALEVLALSSRAERLAEEAGLRRRADGRIESADPALARGLTRAVSAAQAGQQAGLLESASPGLRLMLQATRHLGQPALVLWLRHAPDLSASPPEKIAALFGLTRSEARLADGLSLTEAAHQLGWTIETARSCSKLIFARMGVRGQSGVLRALLTAPLWPADPDAAP